LIKNLAKDGSAYYVDAVIAPVMGSNGKPKKYIGVRYDITEAEVERQNARGILNAIDISFAYAEYTTDGVVLSANEKFISAMKYRKDEIVGKHHRIFVDRDYASSAAYADFWRDLKDGGFKSNVFKQFTRDGSEVWLQAVYAPVKDEMGRVTKVVQISTDITAEKVRIADFEAQVAAVSRSQSVIEFELDGKIRHANENFLKTVGYSLDEIKGKHHSMLVDPVEASGSDYRKFWDELRAGQFQSAQYRRIGKNGNELWIQGTYNPTFDLNGRPCKIVKFATDVTAARKLEAEIAESQKRAQLEEAGRREVERQFAEDQAKKVAVILEVVNAVAEGNFDLEIPDLGTDSVGQVATALGQAVVAMKDALCEVRDVAGTVSTAAQQLTEVSKEITSGAQTQASSLEETASSLEEITSTVKQNTDNAQQARQLANGSRDIAEKGGEVVSHAVKAMAEINESSKKIADIITTIDEIAFQTNLLALNAAVEAARAGEQGRGFAVVAAEVRNLAQRSASAAKEIKSLIHDSVRKVENGTDLVNKSGQTLAEIVNSVKRVTDIVSEIAAASKEQLMGVEQVNKAVAQMDRITQGNSAQTEEMSGTAGSLLSHAVQLNDLVTRFRLEAVEDKRKVGRRAPESKHKNNDRPASQSTRSTAAPIPRVSISTSPTTDAATFEF
jgi:methyl-accepting chemotaxis protein